MLIVVLVGLILGLFIWGIYERKGIIRTAFEEHIFIDLERHQLKLISNEQLLFWSVGNFTYPKHDDIDYLGSRYPPYKIYIDLKVKNEKNNVLTVTVRIKYDTFDGIQHIDYEPLLDSL